MPEAKRTVRHILCACVVVTRDGTRINLRNNDHPFLACVQLQRSLAGILDVLRSTVELDVGHQLRPIGWVDFQTWWHFRLHLFVILPILLTQLPWRALVKVVQYSQMRCDFVKNVLLTVDVLSLLVVFQFHSLAPSEAQRVVWKSRQLFTGCCYLLGDARFLLKNIV